MAIHNDVEVKITLRPAQEPSSIPCVAFPGEALKEYTYPNGTPRIDNIVMMKFIEAVAGQEFQIEVRLLPSFDMLGADDLFVSVTIDDKTVTMCLLYTMAQIQKHQALGQHMIIRDVYDSLDPTQHSKRSFTFGTLEGGE